MNEDFIAATAGEVGNSICKTLLKGSFEEKICRERIQMAHLMKSLALTSVLQYPLVMRHTSEAVPDFQMTIGKRRVAVEMTRIKFQDIECARKLQQTTVNSTLMISNLYPKAGKPRKTPEVIKQGFTIPPFVLPLSIEDEEQAWLTQAQETLEGKTSRIAKNNFAHGDEDWLVIVDPIWSFQPESRHMNGFSHLLGKFWKSKWFTRVFLQDNFFNWQMMFTCEGQITLPNGEN